MATSVNTEQLRASNPFDSVWVAASAGTGKTKVLTDRVLRLLLQSAEPEKILCLTFTNAAAAEMENRVNGVLKEWAICEISDLIQKITELTEEEPDEETIQKARSLFAKVLDAAGGMKIMTIHSFCQSLLKRFPLEADVPPHFEVIDDLTASLMKKQILNEVLALPALKDDLQNLSYFISANAFGDLFGRILNESDRLLKLMAHYPNGLDSVIYALKQYFNIQEYLTEKQVKEKYFLPDEWDALFETYVYPTSLNIRPRYKEEERAHQALETYHNLVAFKVIEATKTLLRVGLAVIEKYQALKHQNAMLDFSDLILKTTDLLSDSEKAGWVLYKLDGGIDHILVDEAQDTNPAQWSIIKAIGEDFFSGESASLKLRTLFVVGDKKQSIYSFQGADPAIFEKMRLFFEKRILDSQNSFENVHLNFSFRSTEPVLRLVNYLLQNPQSKDGVLEEAEEAYHLANRSEDAGLVEIWPVEEAPEKEELNAWEPPQKRSNAPSAMQRMLTRMIDKIEALIGKEELPSKKRPIQAGDILILLQKRGTLMAEIVRLLRERNIPVAGVDKLALSSHLAIQDLMALTEFVLQPNNDLNLANLIKSPLVGLTEEDLYKICVGRGKTTVWHRMNQLYPEQAKRLKEIMNLSDKTPPFEFYSTVLGAFGARKAFVARFGAEVNEALDELLSLSLNFEKTNTPSLQLFLKWFMSEPIEIKRDLDNSASNAVRIMTVHGSKGLQGNIVFLPDTCSTRTKAPTGGEIIWLDGILPLWIPESSLRPKKLEPFFAEQKHLAFQEKRRLLYVALTRASDRLYIGGYGKRGESCWYDLITNAIPPEITPDAQGIIRWESTQNKEVESKKQKVIPKDYESIPAWAKLTPAEEMPSPAPISPSKLDASEEDSFENTAPDANQALALKRGTFLHKLLQYLPELPPEKRLTYAQKVCPAEIELPENLMEIFERPELKDLFGENSLAEVPVVGTLNGQAISGQIDRLVVLPNEVKIIDFKTNRFVPSKVPESYKKQLNAYKDLLKTIFPDKMVHSFILWTQTLHFEEV